MNANKKWKPKLLPYQEQFLKMMKSKQKIVLCGGHNAGKTMLAKIAAVKHLLETGAIKLPTATEMLQNLNDHNAMIESLMVIPKQTLATMAAKDALHFKPHGLGGSVAININIFDQAVKDGYKLNLITGLYEKASRRNRRAH